MEKFILKLNGAQNYFTRKQHRKGLVCEIQQHGSYFSCFHAMHCLLGFQVFSGEIADVIPALIQMAFVDAWEEYIDNKFADSLFCYNELNDSISYLSVLKDNQYVASRCQRKRFANIMMMESVRTGGLRAIHAHCMFTCLNPLTNPSDGIYLGYKSLDPNRTINENELISTVTPGNAAIIMTCPIDDFGSAIEIGHYTCCWQDGSKWWVYDSMGANLKELFKVKKNSKSKVQKPMLWENGSLMKPAETGGELYITIIRVVFIFKLPPISQDAERINAATQAVANLKQRLNNILRSAIN